MESHYVFSTGQRNGIFGLVLVILFLFGVIFWFRNLPPQPLQTSAELKEEQRVQAFIDSLNLEEENRNQSTKIYPFNPNYITDYKGYTLGMSPREIDRLHAFREQEKWVNSVSEFKEVTQVSDSLLNQISPYFKFPDWVEAAQKEKSIQTVQNLTYKQKSDLNEATIKDLQEIKGIGEVLSRRIVRYRNQIDFFVADIQLKDIYGLDFETRDRIINKFTVKTHQDIEKKDLNTVEVSGLLEVPYLDYELARKIVEYRITHEGISSFEELSKIEKFPYGRMDRVRLYLKIKPFKK